MNSIKKEDMTPGCTIFTVHAFLDGGSYIEELRVVNLTSKDSHFFVDGSESERASRSQDFFDAVHVGNDRREQYTFFVSYLDMNIVPNGYNNHRAFATREEAEHYKNHPEIWSNGQGGVSADMRDSFLDDLWDDYEEAYPFDRFDEPDSTV